MAQPFTMQAPEPRCRPTWRDRVGNLFFRNSYLVTPPWDIGRPQPEIVGLVEADEIRGDVLDLGCGTGENALFLAERGHRVVGMDIAPRAIAKAKDKARERGLAAEFIEDSVVDPRRVTGSFDTVIDSGLFHSFGPNQQPCYVATVTRLLRPGGRLFILCFSENEPGTWGPRRITQAEIRAVFRDGWLVRDIRAARFAAHLEGGGVQAWLASIERLAV
jgi:SAM-dependent methyltransferase